ncbi:type I restriction enzyme, S subunit [Treponema bryantii]|uniref:Type I restriction enzyme, S subunit n=1 Tax=Treponema bryantii TaxID=163 RepID=A0A1I3HU88_9SPIR|nr:restriction endonuclease subunit S [Treponema bryantii]SFI39336.1 type I restriction enzyme, S subunit [Treponema bryantii]
MKKDWTIKKLGELSTEKMSYGTSAPSCDYDGLVRYIRITDINDDGTLNEDYVSPKSYEEKHVLKDGDIVFARTGATVGKTYCYHSSNEKYVYAGYLIRLRPDKTIVNPDYLYYTTKSKEYLDFIKNSQAVAAQPNVNAEKYSNFEIPLPPLEEQKRIVAVLDKKFAQIETLKTAAEKNLQNTKQLFQSELEKAFSNTSWEKKRLGDLCESFEYGTSKKSSPNGKVPVLRMGNIQNRELDFTDLVYTNDEIEIEKFMLHKGDVLFNRTNSPEWVGKTAVFNEDFPAIFAGYIIRINYDRKRIDPYFLNYWLNSDSTMKYGFSIMTSSVHQANISGSKLAEYLFPLPPLEEQKHIVVHLDSLSEKVHQLKEIYTKQLADCDELKQSLLQKAFEGEL